MSPASEPHARRAPPSARGGDPPEGDDARSGVGPRLHLDPDEERRAKSTRDRRFHAITLPRMRAVGLGMLVLLVAAHQAAFPAAPAYLSWSVLGTWVALYAVASWLALARWYAPGARLNLGRAFLLLDLIALGGGVWATGAGASWLFVLPYVRAFDQVHIGVRWCATCAAAASLTHLGVVAADQLVGAAPPLGPELFKVGACSGVALYLSMTARIAERLRRRNSRTVAVARDLVRALEEQALDLERARREAEAAADAKASFLATMSHEIRTPLNGVLGMIELAQGSAQETERRSYLGTARASAEALLHVIGDVLDFSKIDAGAMRIEARPFEVREVLAHAVQLVGPSAVSKGLAIGTDCAADVPRVLVGDALRVRQVLLNLLGNAVKFTASGSIELRAARRALPDGSARLELCVRDTGIGIDTAQLSAIFEPFTQAEMSTSRRFGGTGLGLAISRRLAQLMGGELDVASAPGAGSTFTLSLPLVVAEQPEPPPALPDPAPGAAACPDRALHVLLAEDHPVNQRVARLLLERAGHSVEIVDDGAAALAAARGGRFDAVLMDVQMPVLDGLAATRALRAEDVRARDGRPLPVLALTANALAEDRERCLAAGMDGYVAKPVRSDALLAALAAVAPAAPGAA